MSIVTCKECAAGIANGDWTHLDSLGVYEANEMHQRILSNLELYGWLTHNGDACKPGYFDCAVCGEVSIDGGVLWEQEDLVE